MTEIRSPLAGTVHALVVGVGDRVFIGATVAVVESMKMEYAVAAEVEGTVAAVAVGAGDAVRLGDPLVTVQPAPATAAPPAAATSEGATSSTTEASIRSDLAAVQARHDRVLDAARPDAVARRRSRGQRTARENIEALVDPGSFVEYGPLVIAAQRARRSVDDLIDRTPADGMVTGVGTVDGVRTAVLAYDATVLAGTQGHFNHLKKDRLFAIAERERLPVVLFAEGGGGRPGDTDTPSISALDVAAFGLFARLSALVPLVGVTSGRCFAGNAALLGCCDVVIATAGSNIGMGGPAMIEGGGLGSYTPEEVGPLHVQVANGTVDIEAADETEAVAVARRYLSYFSGRRAEWTEPDQRALRDVVPENRRQAYDVRTVLPLLADVDSVLELRSGWAPGMVTALARVDGVPVGIVANNPVHLAGAIDAGGADKAARFLQLCDAHGLPLLFLCDTPGFMVGPDSEEQAAVRHVSRMFVQGANLSVPFGTIVLRKGYGLGAMAMAGGSFRSPLFCVSWPTGEVGGMGLEGAVRLGYRKELDAVADADERERLFDKMVAQAYENGKALNAATIFELDDVIDPAESRHWVRSLLLGDRDAPVSAGKRRPCIDTW